MKAYSAEYGMWLQWNKSSNTWCLIASIAYATDFENLEIACNAIQAASVYFAHLDLKFEFVYSRSAASAHDPEASETAPVADNNGGASTLHKCVDCGDYTYFFLRCPTCEEEAIHVGEDEQ